MPVPRHLGQLDFAFVVAHQRDRSQCQVSLVDSEQDPAAASEDVRFRIAKHLTVYRFDCEPALQPFQIEAGKVIPPARLEVDHTHGARAPGRPLPNIASCSLAHARKY